MLALVVDRCFAPGEAQQVDRLVHHLAAAVEIHPQRLVFGLLPADADAQSDAPAGERVECRDLLGDERRLTLGQHEHLGAEPDALGHGGDVAERDQRLEDRHVGRVRPRLAAFERVAHHDVIEDVDLVVADPLDRTGQLGDALRTVAVHHGTGTRRSNACLTPLGVRFARPACGRRRGAGESGTRLCYETRGPAPRAARPARRALGAAGPVRQ